MQTPITDIFNNWSKAILDRDTNGRFDLPIYKTGCQVMQNFFTNFKGNLIYRSGTKKQFLLPEKCVLVPFKFNQAQNYLFAFGENKLYIYTYDSNDNFVQVQLLDNNDDPVDHYASPYTYEQAKDIRYTQNFDVMYLAQQDVVPQKITRVAANKFLFGEHIMVNSPFTELDTGWPSQTMLYSGRLWYGAPSKKITSVYASKVDLYDTFTKDATIIDDSAILDLRITEIAEKINWLYPGEGSLIAGASDNLAPINGGSYGELITAGNVRANKASIDGCNNMFPMAKDGQIFYVSHNGRYTYFFQYDLLSETFKPTNSNYTSYDITDGGLKKVVHKRDKDDLMWVLKEDGTLLTLNFNQAENIVGWHTHSTQGVVNDIEVITDNYGAQKLFLQVERNGRQYLELMTDLVEFVEKKDYYTDYLSQVAAKDQEEKDTAAYTYKIAQQLRECIHVDNAVTFTGLVSDGVVLTYNNQDLTLKSDVAFFNANDVGKFIERYITDGRVYCRLKIESYVSDTEVIVKTISCIGVEFDEFNNSTMTKFYKSFSECNVGTDYAGQKLSVVKDGGYLADFIVPEDGIIKTKVQAAVFQVGYSFRGVMESFPVGMSFQNGDSSQKNINSIVAFHIRAINTAGGKVGTSFYDLSNVQEMKLGSKNFLPADLINGTIEVSYSDTLCKDKTVFVVQDKPLPLTITGLFAEVNHGSTK